MYFAAFNLHYREIITVQRLTESRMVQSVKPASDVDAAFFIYFLALASIIPCVHAQWKARGQSYLAEK